VESSVALEGLGGLEEYPSFFLRTVMKLLIARLLLAVEESGSEGCRLCPEASLPVLAATLCAAVDEITFCKNDNCA
jgi:hypothetical protein